MWDSPNTPDPKNPNHWWNAVVLSCGNDVCRVKFKTGEVKDYFVRDVAERLPDDPIYPEP